MRGWIAAVFSMAPCLGAGCSRVPQKERNISEQDWSEESEQECVLIDPACVCVGPEDNRGIFC